MLFISPQVIFALFARCDCSPCRSQLAVRRVQPVVGTCPVERYYCDGILGGDLLDFFAPLVSYFHFSRVFGRVRKKKRKEQKKKKAKFFRVSTPN